MRIERLSGEQVEATCVRHLRTLPQGKGEDGLDVGLYRTATGDVVCSRVGDEMPSEEPGVTEADYE